MQLMICVISHFAFKTVIGKCRPTSIHIYLDCVQSHACQFGTRHLFSRRFDVAVEMTTDRTIRVVNHRHKSVAATNSRGNASCIYHTAAKIYQEGGLSSIVLTVLLGVYNYITKNMAYTCSAGCLETVLSSGIIVL